MPLREAEEFEGLPFIKGITYDWPGCRREEFLRRMEPYFTCIDRGNTMIELVMKGCSKAGGMEALLAAEGVKSTGRVCIGTVKGDLHDIGKNLVIMMIESTGYEVVDLGIDVPVERFVEAANDPEITVMGVSALLTTTMPAMQQTVAALNKHPRRGEFKIMVGGAPVDQRFCDSIGADAYTRDAASCADMAVTYVK